MEIRLRGKGPDKFLRYFRSVCSSRHPGFTLLEVMAALTLIAMVLVSIYKMQFQTISMNRSVRFDTIAPLLAQSKMSELKIKPLEEVADSSGDFSQNFPGYTWRVLVTGIESELLEATAKDLRQIEVVISENDGENIYSLKTYWFFQDPS
ncbi:MAG: prepilin-type N-terminal cleavage/methylation domain-containing protein [Desulfobacterales bacterium]|nr:prepilin-type N-terminal cleavage/methylation domain-containing protein [Desulfobacterales bacterium]